jgi:hypothetical protein
MTMAKYVTADGGLWKLTDAMYRQLIVAMQRGEMLDLDKVAKWLGKVENLYHLQEAIQEEREING